jgi:hypothetical protein
MIQLRLRTHLENNSLNICRRKNVLKESCTEKRGKNVMPSVLLVNIAVYKN